MYTSGQLAKRCHVSVRTVQYYDRQGLLHAQRTASNQRCYQEHDFQRLQKILAYRQLGFTLKDIRALLDQQNDQALLTAITLQKQRVQQELQAIQNQLTGLKYLQKQFNHSGNFPGNIGEHIQIYNAHRLTRLRLKIFTIGRSSTYFLGEFSLLFGKEKSGGSRYKVISLALIGEAMVSYYQHVNTSVHTVSNTCSNG
ncbi:MAG: MerR family transcriptional regulator [Limosilactobacillus pontis]